MEHNGDSIHLLLSEGGHHLLLVCGCHVLLYLLRNLLYLLQIMFPSSKPGCLPRTVWSEDAKRMRGGRLLELEVLSTGCNCIGSGGGPDGETVCLFRHRVTVGQLPILTSSCLVCLATFSVLRKNSQYPNFD